MKRFLKAVAALTFLGLMSVISEGQMTTITASKISMGGVPIASGSVSFTPVSVLGIPVAFATGGGGLNAPTAFSCTINAGAITGTCQVPDASLTIPANLLYSIQIRNTGSNQAFSLGIVPNVTGVTWALDAYGPPAQTTNAESVISAQGATVPASCVVPSLFTKTSPPTSFSYCVGGVFVPVVSTGPTLIGTAPITVTNGTIGIQTATDTQSGAMSASDHAALTALGTPKVGPTSITGALADYDFLQGSGTVLTDISGNGNNGTLGTGVSAPTWVPGGLAFTDITSEGVALPPAVNAGKTFVIAAYWTPITTAPCGVNWTGPGPCPGIIAYNSTNYPAWITSSTGSSGINFVTQVAAGSSFGQPMVWDGGPHTTAQSGFSGFHVITWVLGTGSGDLDHIYVDGAEMTYIVHGSTAGAQSSGNLFIGASGVGPWTQSSPQATFYRVSVFTSQYTAAQAAAITQQITAEVAGRGIAVKPFAPLLSTPQLHCIGDSITAGYGLGTSAPYCSLLSLTNQPTYTINNWGLPSAQLQEFTASEANRVAPLCQSSTGGYGVANILAGVNDFISGGATPASAYANLQAEVQALKRGGCKVFVSTLLDYSGTGADANKDAYDALILNGIKASGADGIIDMAADPILGADGAAANATYFIGGLHPTDAGEAHLAAAMSNSLNYYFGTTLANPAIVTSSQTLTSGDRAVSVGTLSSAISLTMPDCTGPSGEIYTISNPQSAFVVTIAGGPSQPINGLTDAITIAPNSTVVLRDVANPKNVSGCHWVM